MSGHNVRLTVCSMIVAVDTVLMFLTGLIPAGTYAFSALAGVPNLYIVMEFGPGWAWAVYFAVSALSFLIAADKEAALLFFLFFGCYPMLKAVFEKKFPRWAAFLLKFLFFNFVTCAEFYVAVRFLGVPKDSFLFFGVDLPWLFLILMNVVFLFYDYALSLLVMQYCRKIRFLLKKWFHPR